MEIEQLAIPGCFSVRPKVAGDSRGTFVKTIVASAYARLGLRADFTEHYYSVSRRDVIRGMHFQGPPHDHDKAVFCLQGRALDVLLDLRRGSPTFGDSVSITLDGRDGSGAYIPSGCAHGFLSLEDDTILMYHLTSEYAPDHDLGVRWDSISFPWPVEKPILSERDSRLPAFSDFASPFSFKGR